MSGTSIMLGEIAQIPEVLRAAADRQEAACASALRLSGGSRPRLLATIGRGSSDHVATYLRYAFELTLGTPSCSVSPSIASVYGKRLDLPGTLCLAISQSGRSPDIVKTARMAREGGALVVAIVNDEASPLASGADCVLPILAGAEKAVAATKTFVGAAVAGLRLLRALDGEVLAASGIDSLPGALEAAGRGDPVDLSPVLAAASAFVVGRGPSLGIAQEAALKLKEVLQFPAEAYSSAEVMHGPWQLGRTDCAMVAWKTDPQARKGQADVVAAYHALGRTVLDMDPFGAAPSGTMADLLAPLVPLPGFYRSLVASAFDLGLDPDRPDLLNKVTETR